MRILHTIDSAGVYGAEIMLLSLAEEQQRRGDLPVVLSIGHRGCLDKPLEAEAARRGLKCIAIRMRDGLNFAGALRIFALARRQRSEVIHSHGYKTNILLGAMPRFIRPIPIVTTLHGWTAQSTMSKLGLYRFLDRCVLPRLDAVVAVKPIALARCKVDVIPNGIASADQEVANDALARQILELKQTVGIVIGAIGRLSPEKNFGALFDALRATGTTVGMVVMGDGPEAPRLRDRASQPMLSRRVLMAGYVAEARQYLPLLDLLVIPSLTEGLPMILLEAMAANLPVIATRVGDVPATLGDLGLLVEPGDVPGLAAAIREMARDLANYSLKASSGRQRVLQHYSAGRMAARYDEVYRQARMRIS